MSFKLPAKRSRASSVTSVSTSRSKSHLSSVSRSSLALAPNPVPSPQRKRVSLRPPSSHAYSGAASNRAPSTAPSSHANEPEDDATIDEREENDSLNEIIMAVDVKGRGNVGCSYYVAREEKLYFMEDVKLGGLEVVETCELPHSRMEGALGHG